MMVNGCCLQGIQVWGYLFRGNAAVSRSERIADQRFSPRVLTAARWADFQAGASWVIHFARSSKRPTSLLPRKPPLDLALVLSHCLQPEVDPGLGFGNIP